MIKLCQKELWGNLALVKLKLKTQFFYSEYNQNVLHQHFGNWTLLS